METIEDLVKGTHVAAGHVAAKKQLKVTSIYSALCSRKELRFFSSGKLV